MRFGLRRGAIESARRPVTKSTRCRGAAYMARVPSLGHTRAKRLGFTRARHSPHNCQQRPEQYPTHDWINVCFLKLGRSSSCVWLRAKIVQVPRRDDTRHRTLKDPTVGYSSQTLADTRITVPPPRLRKKIKSPSMVRRVPAAGPSVSLVIITASPHAGCSHWTASLRCPGPECPVPRRSHRFAGRASPRCRARRSPWPAC